MRRLIFGMLVATAGCPLTASLGGDIAEEEGTSSSGPAVASSSSSSTGPDASSEGGSFGGSADVTSSSSTATSSSTGVDPDPDTTGEEMPNACEGTIDGSCVSCLRVSCCSALMQCLGTPLCACLLGCLEFAPDFLSCVDIPLCEGGPLAGELQVCAASACADSCGF